MGIIVCQTCDQTIAYFDCEKVTTLYGVCPHCDHCAKEVHAEQTAKQSA